jgi:hypothetical protein
MKTLYDGDWVSARPLLNRRFPVDEPACEICREASCATAWVSTKRRVVRCRKCFSPISLDDTGTGINAKRLVRGKRRGLDLSDRKDIEELNERIQPIVASIKDPQCRKRLAAEIEREIAHSLAGAK